MRNFLFLIFLTSTSLVWGGELFAPKEARDALYTLSTFAPAQNVLLHVLQEGDLTIAFSNEETHSFGAFWDGERRIIFLPSKKIYHPEEQLQSILFELHNARTTSHLKELIHSYTKGEISKNDYVLAVEWMEFTNAKQTSLLLKQGIESGFFSPFSTWNIPPTFESYLRAQKKGGHSSWIEQSIS